MPILRADVFRGNLQLNTGGDPDAAGTLTQCNAGVRGAIVAIAPGNH